LKSVPVEGPNINTKYWESHASVSRDGKTMYFTSNRKGGYGNMDIYKSVLQDNGQWGDPVNVGNTINTSLNEDTPFITENDSIFFFSSQGHENMGGYDVFKSRLGPDGQWSVPENLQYPVNSTDDDLFYYPWQNDRIAYVSAIRPDGYGKEDLYAIQKEGDAPLAELIDSLLRTGEVTPAITEEDKTTVALVNTLPETRDEQPEMAKQIAQPDPVPPKVMELEPVYFAYDNFELSENGRNQLEKLFQLMTEFPVVRVKLIGHADAKGSAEYNLKLSEKRAETTKQYLVNKGIDPDKLKITGMGEKNFAAINSNPDGSDNAEGRQLNRRVEYEITGTDDSLLIIKMPEIPEKLKFSVN